MTGQMGFLWAVAAVVWLGILGYVMSMIRRQGRLRKELDFLQHAVSELEGEQSKERFQTK